MVHLARSIALAWLVTPLCALAQSANRGLSQVGSPLNPALGDAELGSLVAFVMGSIRPFANGVGFFLIIAYGLTLVVRQEAEDQLSKSRLAVISILIALVLINLAEPIWTAYMNFQTDGTDIIYTELKGFISWIEEIALIGALILIIGNGIRAVVSYGEGDGLQNMRKVMFSILFGIVLLVVKFTLVDSLAITFRPEGVITSFMYVFNIVLGITALAATVLVIYAGILMVANVGNDEQYTRARSLLLRVAIGLLVIVASGAIVNALLLIQ